VENYNQAGRRLHTDAGELMNQGRYATACHLYGLAAECAIKAFMQSQPGCARIPFKHLPELVDDAKRLLSGRTRAHLLQVLAAPDYMAAWRVENRYWDEACFKPEQCTKYRADSYKALACLHPV